MPDFVGPLMRRSSDVAVRHDGSRKIVAFLLSFILVFAMSSALDVPAAGAQEASSDPAATSAEEVVTETVEAPTPAPVEAPAPAPVEAPATAEAPAEPPLEEMLEGPDAQPMMAPMQEESLMAPMAVEGTTTRPVATSDYAIIDQKVTKNTSGRDSVRLEVKFNSDVTLTNVNLEYFDVDGLHSYHWIDSTYSINSRKLTVGTTDRTTLLGAGASVDKYNASFTMSNVVVKAGEILVLTYDGGKTSYATKVVPTFTGTVAEAVVEPDPVDPNACTPASADIRSESLGWQDNGVYNSSYDFYEWYYSLVLNKAHEIRELTLNLDQKISMPAGTSWQGEYWVARSKKTVPTATITVIDSDTVKVTFSAPLVLREGQELRIEPARDYAGTWNYDPALASSNISVTCPKEEQPPLPPAPDTPTGAGEALEGYWKNINSVENPPMPEKCGINIALVFDMSNSLNNNNGVQGSKDAGNAFIDALGYTPANIGIYNFATYAPASSTLPNYPLFELNTSSGITAAKNAINSLKTGTGTGGTNWEGGLQQVANEMNKAGGTQYDVVYFITDGVPTTNQTQTPGGDNGRVTHNLDVKRGIDGANAVKEAGARLEVIAVNIENNIPSDGIDQIAVLHDDVTEWLITGALREKNGKPYMHRPPSNRFREISKADAERRPTGSYENLTYYDNDIYVNYAVGSPNGVYVRREDATLAKPIDLATKLTTNNLTDRSAVTNLAKYSELATKLKAYAEAICGGSVIIHKQIVDNTGKVIDDTPAGWVFNGSDVTQYGSSPSKPAAGTVIDPTDFITLVDGDGKKLDPQEVSMRTDDETGSVEFKFKTEKPHKYGDLLIEELQQPGYALRQQDGKNAVCTATPVNAGGSSTPITLYENVRDSGFRVATGTDRVVNCIVQNRKVPPVSISVKKVDHENNTQTLPGAEFTLYAVATNEAGEKIPGAEIAKLTADSTGTVHVANNLMAGDYFLIETKAPNLEGKQYELLPSPILINVKEQGGKGVVTVDTVANPQVSVDQNDLSIITVADIYTGTLPKTGGIGFGPILLAAFGLIGAAVVTRRKMTA
ncbi:SpaA isopeptide-forming pilin-related protein [Corynebacterium sp. H78]|uniref:SpaA isopeptide-forming pilin-related protein n=1 Tax=Corynebacterium sp. H78 TaxID=3133417 RepID=UPI0030AA9CB8